MISLYLSLGYLQTKTTIKGSYPTIYLGQKKCYPDIQEMLVWSILNHQISQKSAIEQLYQAKCRQLNFQAERSLEDCLIRLQRRGLIVVADGITEEAALYNLLSCLYIVPVSANPLLKIIAFSKLLMQKTPLAIAKRVFEKDIMSNQEQEVINLARQALLSTAEIIKCVDKKATDLSTDSKILAAIYDDQETTCDNIASLARLFKSRQPVILAVANLYLRQQIIFERGDFA